MYDRFKDVARPDGCECGPVECDKVGNVLKFRTCPRCSKVILDIIRGGSYGIAYVKRGDTVKRVLLKQKEFFSFIPYPFMAGFAWVLGVT